MAHHRLAASASLLLMESVLMFMLMHCQSFMSFMISDQFQGGSQEFWLSK